MATSLRVSLVWSRDRWCWYLRCTSYKHPLVSVFSKISQISFCSYKQHPVVISWQYPKILCKGSLPMGPTSRFNVQGQPCQTVQTLIRTAPYAATLFFHTPPFLTSTMPRSRSRFKTNQNVVAGGQVCNILRPRRKDSLLTARSSIQPYERCCLRRRGSFVAGREVCSIQHPKWKHERMVC